MEPMRSGLPSDTRTGDCGVGSPLSALYYMLGSVASSSRGPTVRLFGGSLVPPPVPVKERKLLHRTVNRTVTRRLSVRGLSEDESKARKHEQEIDVIQWVGGKVHLIEQKDVVAVQVYMARPELHIVPSGG